MALQQLIEQLSEEMGLAEPLLTDAAGSYPLVLDNGITVIIANFEQGFSLNAQLCPCPNSLSEALLTQAMSGNLFGQATKGAILGLSEDYSFFTLALEDANADNYREFSEKLEDFLNSADFWREEILNSSKSSK